MERVVDGGIKWLARPEEEGIPLNGKQHADKEEDSGAIISMEEDPLDKVHSQGYQ
jgi:hypothetical protein